MAAPPHPDAHPRHDRRPPQRSHRAARRRRTPRRCGAGGASMALEDALALARSLSAEPSVVATLSAYEAARSARIVKMVKAAGGKLRPGCPSSSRTCRRRSSGPGTRTASYRSGCSTGNGPSSLRSSATPRPHVDCTPPSRPSAARTRPCVSVPSASWGDRPCGPSRGRRWLTGTEPFSGRSAGRAPGSGAFRDRAAGQRDRRARVHGSSGGLRTPGRGPVYETECRGPIMLTYLTDVRGERIVVVQVSWFG